MDKLLKLKKIPDAVFTINDNVAYGAMQRIKEEGLNIPKDIAVIGFSNSNLSRLVRPSITTVNQRSFDMGKKAAEILIEAMGKKSKAKQIVLKTDLILRESA